MPLMFRWRRCLCGRRGGCFCGFYVGFDDATVWAGAFDGREVETFLRCDPAGKWGRKDAVAVLGRGCRGWRSGSRGSPPARRRSMPRLENLFDIHEFIAAKQHVAEIRPGPR